MHTKSKQTQARSRELCGTSNFRKVGISFGQVRLPHTKTRPCGARQHKILCTASVLLFGQVRLPPTKTKQATSRLTTHYRKTRNLPVTNQQAHRQHHPALTNIKRCKKTSDSPHNQEAPPKAEATTLMRRQQGWTNKMIRQNKGCQQRTAPPSKPTNNARVNPNPRNPSRSHLRRPDPHNNSSPTAQA